MVTPRIAPSPFLPFSSGGAGSLHPMSAQSFLGSAGTLFTLSFGGPALGLSRLPTRIALVEADLCCHPGFIWLFAGAALGLFYQLFVTQAIEFDPQRMTVRKEIRGWERKKKYRVDDYTDLEWSADSEDEHEALKCKVGWRRITVCPDVPEIESIEILTALQRSWPDVAQRFAPTLRARSTSHNSRAWQARDPMNHKPPVSPAFLCVFEHLPRSQYYYSLQ
jgi:hypothetical protein